MNWREYDASFRQRGSLTVWFTDEAIEAWRAEPRTTPGGQPWYSPLAILTALTFRAVFRLALRQTEGLPPRSTAMSSETAATAPTQRDRHLQCIPAHGRAAWQKISGYTKRACAEAAIGRFKQVIGDGLRSRTDERRATEVDVAVHVLNRMLKLGHPISVRIA